MRLFFYFTAFSCFWKTAVTDGIAHPSGIPVNCPDGRAQRPVIPPKGDCSAAAGTFVQRFSRQGTGFLQWLWFEYCLFLGKTALFVRIYSLCSYLLMAISGKLY